MKITMSIGALLFASITGCSSSTSGPTGTRGDAGSPSGVSLGGKDAGSTPSSPSAPSTPSTPSGDVCASAPDDQACLTCTKGSCCAAFAACVGDDECAAIFTCANACADDACVSSCLQAHAGGLTHARALVECQAQSCATACGAPQQQQQDQCLPDEASQGSPDCDGVPGKPKVRDCPYGSPSSACELAPTGSANVYCCPP